MKDSGEPSAGSTKWTSVGARRGVSMARKVTGASRMEGHGVNGAAVEEEEGAGGEFGGVGGIDDPEGTPAGQDEEVLVAVLVEVRRDGLVDAKDAGAGLFAVDQVAIEEHGVGALGEGGGDLVEVDAGGGV